MEIDFTAVFTSLPWNRKLQVLRAMNNWTQNKAAEKCGTSRRIYANWEGGVFTPLERNQRRINEVFEMQIFEVSAND